MHICWLKINDLQQHKILWTVSCDVSFNTGTSSWELSYLPQVYLIYWTCSQLRTGSSSQTCKLAFGAPLPWLNLREKNLRPSNKNVLADVVCLGLPATCTIFRLVLCILNLTSNCFLPHFKNAPRDSYNQCLIGYACKNVQQCVILIRTNVGITTCSRLKSSSTVVTILMHIGFNTAVELENVENCLLVLVPALLLSFLFFPLLFSSCCPCHMLGLLSVLLPRLRLLLLLLLLRLLLLLGRVMILLFLIVVWFSFPFFLSFFSCFSVCFFFFLCFLFFFFPFRFSFFFLLLFFLFLFVLLFLLFSQFLFLFVLLFPLFSSVSSASSFSSFFYVSSFSSFLLFLFSSVFLFVFYFFFFFFLPFSSLSSISSFSFFCCFFCFCFFLFFFFLFIFLFFFFLLFFLLFLILLLFLLSLLYHLGFMFSSLLCFSLVVVAFVVLRVVLGRCHLLCSLKVLLLLKTFVAVVIRLQTLWQQTCQPILTCASDIIPRMCWATASPWSALSQAARTWVALNSIQQFA